MSNSYSDVVKTAQTYYNSSDADRFYATVWGGEDIHIGIYTSPEETIFDASARTVRKMAEKLTSISAESRVIDVGAGYGGAGRYLASTYGCRVACLNLSEAQNERNRMLNQQRNLAHLVEVVDGSFEEIPYEDTTFDAAWSQDAILHSGNRRKVLEEVRRVLKPGGEFVFTDPMQSDTCPEGVLEPILSRIHLNTLGSVTFYRQVALDLGFQQVEFEDLTEQLVNHYGRVRQELQSRYDELVNTISKDYIDRMIVGLGHWVDGGNNGYLSWGIISMR
jgi:sarcosine/dimethylglycine N-methyltransferase